MGAWGIKALERDEGLDVLDILKNEYVPEHPVMDLGEMIELMKEEVMLGADFSQIDFLFDKDVYKRQGQRVTDGVREIAGRKEKDLYRVPAFP